MRIYILIHKRIILSSKRIYMRLLNFCCNLVLATRRLLLAELSVRIIDQPCGNWMCTVVRIDGYSG